MTRLKVEKNNKTKAKEVGEVKFKRHTRERVKESEGVTKTINIPYHLITWLYTGDQRHLHPFQCAVRQSEGSEVMLRIIF